MQIYKNNQWRRKKYISTSPNASRSLSERTRSKHYRYRRRAMHRQDGQHRRSVCSAQYAAMPGEGIQVAVSRVTGRPFPTVKIMGDTMLVILAVISGYCFFGAWPWTVVGPGTLFAMFYVGYVVRTVNPHMGWFDRLLAFRPGFRRYIYGLARFIYQKK